MGTRFLRGMAIMGLATLALSPFRDTKTWAANDEAPRANSPRFLSENASFRGLHPWTKSPRFSALSNKTYIAEGLSSDPELTLELSCSDPHLRNEFLKWKNHIDIDTSFRDFWEENAMMTLEADGKIIQIGWPVPGRKHVGISEDWPDPSRVGSHGYIGGFVPGRANPDGLPIWDEIWLKSGQPVIFAVSESDTGDYTKPLGRLLASIEKSIDCPKAVTDPSALEPV